MLGNCPDASMPASHSGWATIRVCRHQSLAIDWLNLALREVWVDIINREYFRTPYYIFSDPNMLLEDQIEGLIAIKVNFWNMSIYKRILWFGWFVFYWNWAFRMFRCSDKMWLWTNCWQYRLPASNGTWQQIAARIWARYPSIWLKFGQKAGFTTKKS